MSAQFDVVRLEFCCNRKLMEGMVHATTALLVEGEILKTGEGVDCEV